MNSYEDRIEILKKLIERHEEQLLKIQMPVEKAHKAIYILALQRAISIMMGLEDDEKICAESI